MTELVPSERLLSIRPHFANIGDSRALLRVFIIVSVLVIHGGILGTFLHTPRLGKLVDKISFVSIQHVYKQTRPMLAVPAMLQPIPPAEKPPELDLTDVNLSALPPRLDPLSENGSPSIPTSFKQSTTNVSGLIVIVRVHVLKSGKVDRGEVIGSCGISDLDEEAVRYIKNHWHFLPARKDGKPIDSWTNTEVLFKT